MATKDDNVMVANGSSQQILPCVKSECDLSAAQMLVMLAGRHWNGLSFGNEAALK